MYFISNLLFLTKTTGINQNQLSIKMGIARQAITKLLNTNDPRASTLIKISKIYGVSIDDLLLKDLRTEQKNDDK